ncbi:Zn-dependent hydrolase [Luteitalea pratensis]|nr:Zn-dependent hydrolase [Luteitalea pratensis]
MSPHRVTRRDFNATFVGSIAGLSTARPAFAQDTAARVDATRLQTTLMDLRRFGGTPAGGTHRLGYSTEDKQARLVVAGWMQEAGLVPATDLAGNLIGRRAGSTSGLPPIVFGSHIDSVPDGGSYDGNVGTMAAIEVARTLQDRRVTLRHPIEVAVWANEEGGLFGSRAVSGQFEETELAHVTSSGKTVRDGISFVGGDPARLGEARRDRGSVAAYLELHIEQGGILEAERVPIGIVEGIVGIRQWDVTVTGLANHAGTTPMDKRQDALLAAARFVDMVNRVVRATPGRQVGTVGRMQVSPGARNVVPGSVVCSLELRDLDAAAILRFYDAIRGEADRIGDATGTTFAYRELHVNAPAPSDPHMRSIIADAARALGLETKVMPSGAGHDAQAIAQLGPMGMIFIPSVGGISHSPKEFSHPTDIANGANVLLGAVMSADAI